MFLSHVNSPFLYNQSLSSSRDLLLLRLINNDFGIGAHISLKLRINETHMMSFISVPVLAKN